MSVVAHDPDGVAGVTPCGGRWTGRLAASPMAEEDGRYIDPGQPAGTLLQIYVEAGR
ncbi:MAG: hypothetical protein R3F43_26935 [bacterium]